MVKELQLLIKLQELSDATLMATAGFPGQYAHTFRDRIVGLVIDAVQLTNLANTIVVNDVKTYQQCRLYQAKVLSSLRTLEQLMQQAARLRVVNIKKLNAWCGLLTETKKLYYGWCKVYPKAIGANKN